MHKRVDSIVLSLFQTDCITEQQEIADAKIWKSNMSLIAWNSCSRNLQKLASNADISTCCCANLRQRFPAMLIILLIRS